MQIIDIIVFYLSKDLCDKLQMSVTVKVFTQTFSTEQSLAGKREPDNMGQINPWSVMKTLAWEL